MMGENIPGAGFGQTPAATSPGPSRTPSSSGQDDGFSLWDSDGFGFGDLLDIVNPLQHLPVISTFYRDLTGDDIGHAARVLGGGLFGGPIGAAVSFGNALVDEITGDDLGGHMLALARDITGGDEGEAAPDGPVMVADAGRATPFEDAAGDAWVPSQMALANAVDDGDHLLVARQVRAGTMNEPGEWEWVRVPKHAGATPQDAGEALGNPAAAALGNAAAGAPEPTVPPDDVPAAGPARTPDVAPGPPAQPAREGAAAPQSAPNHDPLLAEAEKLFSLGLQYEPGSEWARLPRDDGDDGNEQATDAGAARTEAAAPANPFDPASPSAPAGPWVVNAMQEGLDKYRSMIDRQGMPGRPTVDVDL